MSAAFFEIHIAKILDDEIVREVLWRRLSDEVKAKAETARLKQLGLSARLVRVVPLEVST